MTPISIFCSPTPFLESNGRDTLWPFWNKEMHLWINLHKLGSNIEWLVRKLIWTISVTIPNHELYSTQDFFSFIIISDAISILSDFFSFLLLHYLMKNSFYIVHTFCVTYIFLKVKHRRDERRKWEFFSVKPIVNLFICMCVREHPHN